MSFEDNPADDRYQIDQCIDEIKRLKAARDALAGELARVEAAIDAAGGTKFETNDTFIARLAAQRNVLLSACEAFLEECRDTIVDPSEMSAEWQSLENQVRQAVQLCKPLSLNEI